MIEKDKDKDFLSAGKYNDKLRAGIRPSLLARVTAAHSTCVRTFTISWIPAPSTPMLTDI